MRIIKTRNIVSKIIPILAIILLTCSVSAQPGGHHAPHESDTVRTSFRNHSIDEFQDPMGLLYKIHLKNGIKHGATEIYQNGVLVERSQYKRGEKNGRSEMYFANGTKHTDAIYKNGFRFGKYKQYYITEGLKLEAKYKIFTLDTLKKSVYNGSFKSYDQNGEVVLKGNYSRGEKTGVWKTYSKGKLVKTETYKNGVSQSETNL